MTSTFAPLWASIVASTPPYGFLPMILLSRVTAPIFRFMGGYATIHLLRCNALFSAPPPQDSYFKRVTCSSEKSYCKSSSENTLGARAEWLRWTGGLIYDGEYRPQSTKTRTNSPTLSEILARHVASSYFLMGGVLLVSLMGAGVSGFCGGAVALLFDGENGRSRYQMARRAVKAGEAAGVAAASKP